MAVWMTVPQWEAVQKIDLLRREQDPSPLPQTNAPRNFHVLVRGRLELPQGEYRLRITADDYYYAWLDGAFLGCGPAQGYPSHYYYQEYAIPGGQHTVALHLYYQGLVNRAFCSGDGRFGLWLSVLRGSQELACCDETWCFQICDAWEGDTVGYDTQFLENFDSRKYPEGWELPSFDDGNWPHLVPAAWADYRLIPQPTRNLQWSKLEPAHIHPIPGGVLVDFGKEIIGLLHCRAQGPEGDKLQFLYTEAPHSPGLNYRETWVLKDGENLLHPFDYKAFRYVKITPAPQEIFAWVRHYPMDDSCSLHCRTDQLEDIFAICKNGVRCCTQESYLDCPTREKGQYLGDAILTARSQLWLTGKTDMLRKCIADFMSTNIPSLLAVAPGNLMQEIADFSLLFPMLALMDYDFTGDREFLRDCYPAAAAMTREFEVYARPDGLLANVSGQWNLVDWPENYRDGYDFPLTRPVVGEGCHNVVNALWYGALKMQEEMEEILDLPQSRRSEQVKAAFLSAFYREDQQLFADSTQSSHCSLHANIYPAFFGIHPAPDRFEALMLRRQCGVFPMYFGLKALARMGKYDTFYRLLTREDPYGWRNMLREGATACFEVWGMDQKWNTSLCHGWASYPISLIIEDLAGIRPTAGKLEFSAHLPPHLKDFELTFPFGGKQYRTNGKELIQC